MGPRLFAIVLCVLFLNVITAFAQTPTANDIPRSSEELWQEYMSLRPTTKDLLTSNVSFEEPYYTWSFEALLRRSISLDQIEQIFCDMFIRMPARSGYFFHEFWKQYAPRSSVDNLSSLFMNIKANDEPGNEHSDTLDWFRNEIAKELLTRPLEPKDAARMVCYGPAPYRELFWNRFLASNPSVFDLTIHATYDCAYRKEIMIELIDRYVLEDRDLLNLLGASVEFPDLEERVFSILTRRELSVNELDELVMWSRSQEEWRLSFALSLRESAVVQRKQALEGLMFIKR